MFFLGFLTDGGVSMIGLVSMEVVPVEISGSAHGLACAMAQGMQLIVLRGLHTFEITESLTA